MSDFLTRVLREQDFDFRNPDEVIYWYCYFHHYGFHKAEEYKERYASLTPNKDYSKALMVYDGGLCLDTEERLFDYLAYVKAGTDDPMSEKSRAFQEFLKLYQHARQIIAAMYQKDEEEKGRDKIWTAGDITPSDVEKVICSGIPINQNGQPEKDVSLYPGQTFQPEAFQPAADHKYFKS